MAKKYQAIETKIHPLTWVIMGLIVVTLLTLFIALQPSEKDNVYLSYLSAAGEEAGNFEKKLPENNKMDLLKSLDGGWFSDGLIDLAHKDNQITIVVFTNASLPGSSMALANAYAYLYGLDVAPVSNLYSKLDDNRIKFYLFETSVADMNSMAERLNDEFEDLELNTPSMPYIMAFFNGEVLEHGSLTVSNVPTYLRYTFYKNIFVHEAIQDLLDE